MTRPQPPSTKRTVREVISTLRGQRYSRVIDILETADKHCNKPTVGYVTFFPHGRKRHRCAECCKEYKRTEVTYYDDDT